MHTQQQYVRLNYTKNSHNLLVSHERLSSKYYFLSKNMAGDLPQLHVICI